MNKAIFLLLIILVPFVSAEGLQIIASPSTNTTLYFNCLNNNNFVNSKANLTIIDANLNNFINNVPLNLYDVGKFSYNFITPAQTGLYELQLYCDDLTNNQQGYNTAVMQIKDIQQEAGFDMLAIAIFFLGLLALILYWSKQEFIAGGIHKAIGWGLYMLSIPVSMGISYFILLFSEGKNYYGFAETIFTIHIIVGSMAMVVMLIFVFIDATSKSFFNKGSKELLK